MTPLTTPSLPRKAHSPYAKRMVQGPTNTSPLYNPTPDSHKKKKTPRQTDGWSCGLHMLLINLATIYQGEPPTLRHTQRQAEQLSHIQLRYPYTGELDPVITQMVTELKKHNNTHPWEAQPIPSPPLKHHPHPYHHAHLQKTKQANLQPR